MNIRIKYFSDKLERLRYVDGKSDWIDLRAAEDVELKAGEFKLIPLGIAMELPRGYEAHIVPRSSTFKNFGIIQTNLMGVVDESYCGDNDQWFFPAYALRDTQIRMNDQMCIRDSLRSRRPYQWRGNLLCLRISRSFWPGKGSKDVRMGQSRSTAWHWKNSACGCGKISDVCRILTSWPIWTIG